MRGDVNVHRALLAAPKEVGAQAWPYTPRGRAALPAGESGAARGRLRGGLPPGPMVTLSRAKHDPLAAAGPRHCRFCTRARVCASARGRSQGTTHKSHARARPRFRFAMRERA